MSLSGIVLILIIISLLGFWLGKRRAQKIEAAGIKMHSRPYYYGWYVLLVTFIPAIVFLLLWQFGSTLYLEHVASAKIPSVTSKNLPVSHSLVMATIEDLLAHPNLLFSISEVDNYNKLRDIYTQHGFILPLQGADYMVKIAREWALKANWLGWCGAVLNLLIAFLCFGVTLLKIKPKERARNRVEVIIKIGLITASTIAILTTIGIVLSMLFQTISFFKVVPLETFFLGTVWDPRFSAAGSDSAVGQFGLLPLLAGTFYIALVAMIFAVPVGLFAAIYMSEYASSRARAIIKPLLEVLAGIPTIVYGFFALITVGPFLRDLSIALAGGQGFIMAQSIFTAGLVMGIMLIPFVSSLSDDIITAVPRSLRDGSYGLGATRSETIKKVVVPAALPGIIGAILLTASRAIGETMIVVLAAGVAANLTINPFDAMTTITIKIVNQLTGDLEFNSPQTLVAFALGMTLFVLTLLMNIIALYIVRKYREQYE